MQRKISLRRWGRVCLINFHYDHDSKYRLIVAANRDEVYQRPTDPAHFWSDIPSIIAGRDLLQMGTWLGMSKEGRFAAITNYRDPRLPERPYSRGDITKTFLSNTTNARTFIQELKETRDLYGGYNVLLWDGDELLHYNNIFDEKNIISPGTHSLSNSTLNTPWPKVVKGRTLLSQYIQESQENIQIEDLFQILKDREKAPDDQLPDTGVGIEMERNLSPLFIHIPYYGTRCSTVLLVTQDGHVTFVERTYHKGKFQFEKSYQFQLV